MCCRWARTGVRLSKPISTASRPPSGPFPPATQGELAQLLSILSTSLGCRALTGIAKPWGSGSIPELQSALQGMRVSRLSVRQQVYQALRDLTNGAYFADPSAWTLLTYPGPRDI